MATYLSPSDLNINPNEVFFDTTENNEAPTQTATEAIKNEPGMLESGLRGGVQGFTFDFADEAQAAVESLLGNGKSYLDTVKPIREAYKAAEEANPWTYNIANFASGLVPSLVTGGAKAIGQIASPAFKSIARKSLQNTTQSALKNTKNASNILEKIGMNIDDAARIFKESGEEGLKNAMKTASREGTSVGIPIGNDIRDVMLKLERDDIDGTVDLIKKTVQSDIANVDTVVGALEDGTKIANSLKTSEDWKLPLMKLAAHGAGYGTLDAFGRSELLTENGIDTSELKNTLISGAVGGAVGGAALGGASRVLSWLAHKGYDKLGIVKSAFDSFNLSKRNVDFAGTNALEKMRQSALKNTDEMGRFVRDVKQRMGNYKTELLDKAPIHGEWTSPQRINEIDDVAKQFQMKLQKGDILPDDAASKYISQNLEFKDTISPEELQTILRSRMIQKAQDKVKIETIKSNLNKLRTHKDSMGARDQEILNKILKDIDDPNSLFNKYNEYVKKDGTFSLDGSDWSISGFADSATKVNDMWKFTAKYLGESLPKESDLSIKMVNFDDMNGKMQFIFNDKLHEININPKSIKQTRKLSDFSPKELYEKIQMAERRVSSLKVSDPESARQIQEIYITPLKKTFFEELKNVVGNEQYGRMRLADDAFSKLFDVETIINLGRYKANPNQKVFDTILDAEETLKSVLKIYESDLSFEQIPMGKIFEQRMKEIEEIANLVTGPGTEKYLKGFQELRDSAIVAKLNKEYGRGSGFQFGGTTNINTIFSVLGELSGFLGTRAGIFEGDKGISSFLKGYRNVIEKVSTKIPSLGTKIQKILDNPDSTMQNAMWYALMQKPEVRDAFAEATKDLVGIND